MEIGGGEWIADCDDGGEGDDVGGHDAAEGGEEENTDEGCTPDA
jgi:hypothetical protein